MPKIHYFCLTPAQNTHVHEVPPKIPTSYAFCACVAWDTYVQHAYRQSRIHRMRVDVIISKGWSAFSEAKNRLSGHLPRS